MRPGGGGGQNSKPDPVSNRSASDFQANQS